MRLWLGRGYLFPTCGARWRQHGASCWHARANPSMQSQCKAKLGHTGASWGHTGTNPACRLALYHSSGPQNKKVEPHWLSDLKANILQPKSWKGGRVKQYLPLWQWLGFPWERTSGWHKPTLGPSLPVSCAAPSLAAGASAWEVQCGEKEGEVPPWAHYGIPLPYAELSACAPHSPTCSYATSCHWLPCYTELL